MKVIIKSIFRTSILLALGITLFSSATVAASKNNAGMADKMDVAIASVAGTSNYNLEINTNPSGKDVFVTIYDSNNNVILAQKLSSSKLLKKKYNLDKYHSTSFFFVIESGNKVHTEEVM